MKASNLIFGCQGAYRPLNVQNQEESLRQYTQIQSSISRTRLQVEEEL